MYIFSDLFSSQPRGGSHPPWWKQGGMWIGIAGTAVALFVPIIFHGNTTRHSPEITGTPGITQTSLPSTKTTAPTSNHPSHTPSPPTHTPTSQAPTRTLPPPSSTPRKETSAQAEWQTLLLDRFDANTNVWDTGTLENDFFDINIMIADGQYL